MDFKMGEELLFGGKKVICIGRPNNTHPYYLTYGYEQGWKMNKHAPESPVMRNKCLVCGFTDKLYWVNVLNLRRVDA